jgi:hypothetical protein
MQTLSYLSIRHTYNYYYCLGVSWMEADSGFQRRWQGLNRHRMNRGESRNAMLKSHDVYAIGLAMSCTLW